MKTDRVVPMGPFDLATSSKFLCGFTPAEGSSGLDARTGTLVLGFLDDRSFEPTIAAVSMVSSSQNVVAIQADSSAVVAQVGRILSLDHDATPLAAIARRDEVVRELLRAKPGFRPVVFPSPYEAAVWGVMAQRIPMRVAASLKTKLSEATGTKITGFGKTFFPAPTPKKLLAVKSFQGLSSEKLERMHGVARAALDGKLDPYALRAMPEDRAIGELEKLRGVGAWTSRHVLYRGCGVADAVPGAEPRVLRGVGAAYGLGRTATLDELDRISEAWRPLRMWVSILLVWSASHTAAWHGPEKRGNFSRARASKGNALSRREGSPEGADRRSRQEPLFD
ncbi:DNA-3-methyladenine glycosylase [soil metagenome]